MTGNKPVTEHLLRDDHIPIDTEPTPLKTESFDTNELADEKDDWVITQVGLWENSKDPSFRLYLQSLVKDWKSKGGDAVDLWAMGLVEYEKLKEARLFSRQELTNAHSFLGLIHEYVSQTEEPESLEEINVEWPFLYAEDLKREEEKRGIFSDTPLLIAQTAMAQYPDYQTGYQQAA